MPSDRKQVNVRVDDETEALVAKLLVSVRAGIGIAVSQSDLFRLGMLELAKKYPPAPEAPAPAPPPTRPAAKRKRSG